MDYLNRAIEFPGHASDSSTVFEAVCQARGAVAGECSWFSCARPQGVLYVLVYRMESIADQGGAPIAVLLSLPLERCLSRLLARNGVAHTFLHRLLSHPCEPLRACAPVVTLEYARRAKALRMPGRYAARVAAAATGVDYGVAQRGRRLLDTFFPFDPFLLRRSAVHLDLKRYYIRWQSSEGNEFEYDSDDRSTASGLDRERPSSMVDSYREHFGVAMGLARPAPLGAMAMSYEEAVTLGARSLSLTEH